MIPGGVITACVLFVTVGHSAMVHDFMYDTADTQRFRFLPDRERTGA